MFFYMMYQLKKKYEANNFNILKHIDPLIRRDDDDDTEKNVPTCIIPILWDANSPFPAINMEDFVRKLLARKHHESYAQELLLISLKSRKDRAAIKALLRETVGEPAVDSLDTKNLREMGDDKKNYAGMEQERRTKKRLKGSQKKAAKKEETDKEESSSEDEEDKPPPKRPKRGHLKKAANKKAAPSPTEEEGKESSSEDEEEDETTQKRPKRGLSNKAAKKAPPPDSPTEEEGKESSSKKSEEARSSPPADNDSFKDEITQLLGSGKIGIARLSNQYSTLTSFFFH